MKAEASPDRTRRILRWSWAAGGVVLVLGLLVVVAPAVRHAGTLFDDPFRGQMERRTVETLDAAGRVTGTVVTTEPAGSWLERSLGPGGVLLLRLAVVAVAAFMAGALVYRTASGSFPSEVGGVVFAENTGAGLEELTRAVETALAELQEVRADVERVSAAGADGVAAVATLSRRINGLGERSDELETTVARLASGLAETVSDLEAVKARARPRSPKGQ